MESEFEGASYMAGSLSGSTMISFSSVCFSRPLLFASIELTPYSIGVLILLLTQSFYGWGRFSGINTDPETRVGSVMHERLNICMVSKMCYQAQIAKQMRWFACHPHPASMDTL